MVSISLLNVVLELICFVFFSVHGNVDATVKAIYFEKKFLDRTASISEDAAFGIILDKTGFYAEAGGQEYDTGSITTDGVAEPVATEPETTNVAAAALSVELLSRTLSTHARERT